LNTMTLFDSSLYTWIILPFLIFVARIADVSIGTVKLIFISRGLRSIAPILGFLEVLIWLLAIGQIMRNLTNPVCYVAYAGGFATGTYVGMYIERKLAMGNLLVRLITRKDATELIDRLKAADYGVTVVDAQGSSGLVHVLYTVIKRGDLEDVVGIIKQFNPRAFFTVEDIRTVSEGIFPMRRTKRSMNNMNFFGMRRKEK
jgi:uncharacterized protein YebE (UPF0316 family)